MLSYCLVGLASYCSNASGTKWYVDDGPHLNKMYLNTWTNGEFLLELVQYILWTGKMGENGQSFIRIAKSLWDQTVGSDNRQSGLVTPFHQFGCLLSGSLSTGSPVGPSPKGLMYSQATVTATGPSSVCVIRWIENWSLGSTERHIITSLYVLERYPARVLRFLS